MSINRRDFIKTIGLVGITLTVGDKLGATPIEDNNIEFSGVLIDTTKCVGCRNCEYVCAEANGFPEPNEEDFIKKRKTSEKCWTVVNEFGKVGEEIYVKKQCMHCNQPACAAACLTKAMYKTKEGPVIWRESKCMGCRVCMISCPFDVPKFEANSPNPKIQKCRMCFEHLQKGEIPVCVENCLGEALLYGKRRDLIEIARTRIYAEPEKYNHHIYGEHEVGGTGVLYLASVPFEQLEFKKDLGTTAYPEFSKGFLYAVPLILSIWPVFLLGLHKAIKGRNNNMKKGDNYE